MLKLSVERPVEPLTIALLRDVKGACAQLGTRFVLAGATARDILLWHLHDIKAPVATRDVDVAVCAVSWEFHDMLIDLLLQTQRFRRHPKQQQKFLFKRSPDDYEIEHNRPFGMATPMYSRTAQDTRHSSAKCGCHRLVNLHCKARFNIGHRVAN